MLSILYSLRASLYGWLLTSESWASFFFWTSALLVIVLVLVFWRFHLWAPQPLEPPPDVRAFDVRRIRTMDNTTIAVGVDGTAYDVESLFNHVDIGTAAATLRQSKTYSNTRLAVRVVRPHEARPTSTPERTPERQRTPDRQSTPERQPAPRLRSQPARPHRVRRTVAQ